jgi:hypothetical protein
VYQALFRDTLRDEALRRRVVSEGWYRQLLGARLTKENTPCLTVLGEYAEHALRWWGGIALLNATSDNVDDPPKDLIRADWFARLGPDSETGTRSVQVEKSLTSAAGFSRLVRGEPRPLTLPDVYRTLTQTTLNSGAAGIGCFVRALHDVVAG